MAYYTPTGMVERKRTADFIRNLNMYVLLCLIMANCLNTQRNVGVWTEAYFRDWMCSITVGDLDKVYNIFAVYEPLKEPFFGSKRKRALIVIKSPQLGKQEYWAIEINFSDKQIIIYGLDRSFNPTKANKSTFAPRWKWKEVILPITFQRDTWRFFSYRISFSFKGFYFRIRITKFLIPPRGKGREN